VVVQLPVVEVELVAAVYVPLSDDDHKRKMEIKSAFADEAGVELRQVTVGLTPGSGVIRVSIQLDDLASATMMKSKLAEALSSASAAAEFLEAASIDVISRPAVSQRTKVLATTAPPPPPTAPSQEYVTGCCTAAMVTTLQDYILTQEKHKHPGETLTYDNFKPPGSFACTGKTTNCDSEGGKWIGVTWKYQIATRTSILEEMGRRGDV